MASTYTSNFELEKQAAGDNSGTWGDPILNTNVIQRIDDALGKTTSVALSSSNVTLTQTQWHTKALLFTGTLSANVSVSLPLSVNDVGSTTAVGGEFVVDNSTSGAFTVTVKTAATGSTGVEVPQGFRSVLYSDAADVVFADDQSRSTLLTNAGNPNGSVSGTAGSAITPASFLFDRTNGIIYGCTTTGTVWAGLAAATVFPQGYLTASSNANNVIITGDSTGASTLYYTPYVGGFVPINNGSFFTLLPFSQLTLTLSASQAANNIYDVYVFMDGTTLRVGTGPSWSAGSGGSVTAGSCARGTGAGGAAIQRVNGIWVNTASMTMTNGASTYSVDALKGTCVGSIFIDGTQGQVTCHRTYGQSRKFGVWNFYNRVPLYLKAGDPTSTWSGASGTRPSNNSSANSLTVFCGLAEEVVLTSFTQRILSQSPGSTINEEIGIGWNSTTTFSGQRGITGGGVSGGAGNVSGTPSANYQVPPFLGINVATSLEDATTGTSNNTLSGTESYMLLLSQWRG